MQMARRKVRRRIRKKKRNKLQNPACRPSRYKRYKYLGKKVKDVGSCGLDTMQELRGIAKAIIKDYKSGEIDKRTAHSRFALLCNIVVPNQVRKGKLPRSARKTCREYWERLKKIS